MTMLNRAKQTLRVLPYLLPAFVLLISLASAIAGSQTDASHDDYIPFSTPVIGDGGGTTEAHIDTADGAELRDADSLLTRTLHVENRPPVLTPNPFSQSTSVNTPVTFALPATDPEFETVVATIVSPIPAGASASISPALFMTYTPAAGFTGTQVILVRLSDGHANSQIVTVRVVVS